MFRLWALASAALIALPVFASAAPALAAEFPPELAKVIEGAKKEGKLVLSTSASMLNAGPGIKTAVDGFNKMYGTNVEVTWSPGPHPAQIGGKLLAERQANQEAFTDAIICTPAQCSPFAKQGLFQQVAWDKMMPDRIKPEYVEANGTSLRVYTGLPMIEYNKSEEARMAGVTSLQDFLKPEWKGKFYSTIQLSGFDVLLAEGSWGEKKLADWVRPMAKQAAGLIECGADDRIASGEVPVFVIDCGGQGPNIKRFNGAIKGKLLPEVAQIRYFYVAVPKHAAHPNAAILFGLWWATPEAQRYHWDVRAADNSDYPDSTRRKEIIEPLEKQGVKFVQLTIDWWDKQKGLSESFRRVLKIAMESGAQ
jgi:ABC-type Fe3+ transport system substrate-binding protein